MGSIDFPSPLSASNLEDDQDTYDDIGELLPPPPPPPTQSQGGGNSLFMYILMCHLKEHTFD